MSSVETSITPEAASPKPASPITMSALSNALWREENLLNKQPLTQEAVDAHIQKLYTAMKRVSVRNNERAGEMTPEELEAEQIGDASIFRTAIARALVVSASGERSRLSNNEELARWHQDSIQYIRDVLRLENNERAATKRIAEFWDHQEKLFVNPVATAQLKEQYDQHKAGVLAAVAFEESLEGWDEWRVQPTDAKVDAARAIDYVLRGPENTTYLVQLTSTRWREAIPIKRKVFTDREPKRDASSKTYNKEMRFWRGAHSFIAGRQLKPSSVRAVFLQLSQNNIDATTGRPDAALKGEIGKYLDHLVAPDYAWSEFSRRPR